MVYVFLREKAISPNDFGYIYRHGVITYRCKIFCLPLFAIYQHKIEVVARRKTKQANYCQN